MEDVLNDNVYTIGAFKCCCMSLRHFITLRKTPDAGAVILYEPVWRLFSSPFGASQDKGMDVSIHFCPFCGEKFPDRLGDKWEEVLREELGEFQSEKESFDDFFGRVPPEFQSDEWWKKRGF